jgi:eukaryotic-like serine/threonine-protein kinase
MPISAGDHLGPYEILSPIGAGGMGEVWKARDKRLDRIVAIKTSARNFSERFEREARAIAALNHPHICQIYDVGPDYLVMEYIEGQPISGPLPLDLALKAAIQLAAALEAAHRKSIVHRDLKPANILTTKSGVKVLDFGLAKLEVPANAPTDETQTRALTQEGTIVGTLQYMAPEQLQGKPVDPRSDIFAFGCVLYEILTGKRAFRGENQATLIASIIDRDPEPISLHQPMIPPMLERVVKKCLAKDPDDRWQTASDLKSELQWILDGGSNAAMPAPVVERRRRNAHLGWMVAAGFAVLFAAAMVFHFRSVPPPATPIRFEIPLPEGTSWGAVDFPVLSPDGSRILFGAMKRDGSHGLWIRSMDSVVAQPVPGTDSRTPFTGTWSPDGRSIVFVASDKLQRLELGAGSSPQILNPTRAWGPPAWSPAGMILVSQNIAPFPVMQVPASGGDATPMTAPGGEQDFPSFLPDGRSFLYSRLSGSEPSLYLGKLGEKAEKRLGPGSSGVFVEPNWILYIRGSNLVAQRFDSGKQVLIGDTVPIADHVAVVSMDGAGFSVARNGTLAYRTGLPVEANDLTWFDRQGKRLGTVGERAVYTNPALSPDGKRLAVGRDDPATSTRDIWVLDLVRNVSSRFTFDKADDLNPLWSPDGSKIAFSSERTRSGERDIYWKAASGAGADELLSDSPGSKSVEDWSPDGKLLLFNLNNVEVHALPLDGDRKPYPLLKAPFTQAHARVSPDGHWLAYTSSESGRTEVFVQNFPPSGGKWQISNDGGNEPSWRRDGKELYFISGTTLQAVDVKAAGSGFEAGVPKTLFDVPGLVASARRNRYLATPDGQRFLFIVTEKSSDTLPITVVQNWQSALKR